MNFLEQALRDLLSNPQTSPHVREAMGWDAPSASRFLSGQTGVTIEKIMPLLKAIGFVAVSTKYFDAVATLGEVGAHCECARQGNGECGRSAK